MNKHVLLTLLATFALTACDSLDGPDESGEYDIEVLSVSETMYNNTGTPGLAFEIMNVGTRSVHNLEVTVVPEPLADAAVVVHHAAQALAVVRPGQSVSINVPLTSRASRDDYSCYRYDVVGFDGSTVPAGQPHPVALYKRYRGTCAASGR